jgi:hypothetical protein
LGEAVCCDVPTTGGRVASAAADPCCNNPDPCCGAAEEPKFEIEEVTFTNDHQMYAEAGPCNSDGCWGDGAALDPHDWKRRYNPDHPVCYTKNSRMWMNVKLKVTANRSGTATLKAFGPGGISGTRDFAVTCGTHIVEVSSLGTSRLPEYVTLFEPMWLTWSVLPPGGSFFKWIGNTENDMYVTYWTPSGSRATRTRMKFLCESANGLSNSVQITHAIHDTLDDDPPNDGLSDHDTGIPYILTSYWELMSGLPYGGECHTQAHFMGRCLRLAGVLDPYDPALVYPIFASTDAANPFNSEELFAEDLGIARDLDMDRQIGDERLG